MSELSIDPAPQPDGSVSGSGPAGGAGGSEVVPRAPFSGLEALWIQVTGTICNLRCSHCFISCSPDNDTLEFMERNRIREAVGEAAELGVKELYYTGGEPFLHPEIHEILADALSVAPTTVLTNGVLITEGSAARLGRIARSSPYSLEVRVSLDAPDEEANDRVRGDGVFRRALRGVRRLQVAGLLPIVTATELVPEEDGAARWSGNGDVGAVQGREVGADARGRDEAGREVPVGVDPAAIPPRPPAEGFYRRFHELLVAHGIDKPRVKILPVFNMGMLEGRREERLLDRETLEGFDFDLLQCTSSRLVAHDGVYACPILAGEPGAKMSSGGLRESLGACDLYHPSCTTCYVTGMTCRNA